MARTNVAVKTPAPKTHEGAKAVRIDAVAQLRRSVLATMLWEDTFYESGESIADRISNEVKDVLKLKNGSDIVANLAVEARSKFKLRHAPLHLINGLVAANTKDTRAVVSGALYHAIQRPDEINEFIAQYWAKGKRPLPNQVKKGLAAAFNKFDEYSLGKYANRDAKVKLRDALFLVHAKPKDAETEALFRKLADNELKAPEETWEVRLSRGEDKKTVFTELFSEGTGALATLRNLRNAIQAGVEDSVIRHAINNIKVERVLPFRFITAAKYAPKFEPELEKAMLKCLAGQEKLPGKTVLVVDNSGSMYGMKVSSKSELDRQDAASALAMLLREICEEVQVVVFGSTAGLIAPRHGFALRDAIRNSGHSGGTNTQTALKVAAKEGYDRVIVFTDEQSHQTIKPPVSGTKGYFINVASYEQGIGYGDWVHLDGFSEAVIQWIIAYENEQ